MGENNVENVSEECVVESQTNGSDGTQIQKRNYDSLSEENGSVPDKPNKKQRKIKPADESLKNPVSVLNEMYKGLKYNFVQQRGQSNNPIFTVEVELGGQKYYGEGRSKSLAKHCVAKKILNIIDPTKVYADEPQPELGGSFSSGSETDTSDRIGDRNPVSILNELRVGLKYNVLEQQGPAHAPFFKVSVEVDGQTYNGIGRSKKLAKCAAAEEALKSFIQFPNNKRIGRTPENVNCDFSLDQFETKKRPVKKPVVGSGNHKGPVMQLNEAFPSAEYVCVDTEGEMQNRYKVTVEINGQKFIGTGSSKKYAKKAAAATALLALLNIHTPVINNISPGFRKTKVTSQEQEKADFIGRLVNEKFASLMANDMMHAKRKVLAGIVQMRGDDLSSAQVIAVTTGTKCIAGSSMSLTGTVLNDLHAEIVSRRCLISYFYDQLALLLDSDTARQSIFAWNGKNAYCLKPDIDFHLYINTAPCGDARIFSPCEVTVSGDKHPNRISRGQLRTKIESGEGTIPVKTQTPIQTWDGILQGERILTMSCSDKICKWNVLGIQGALLSNIIEPIYLKTVVLGSLLHETHLERAINGRIENTLQGLPPPYKLNRPSAFQITSAEVRFPGKAPSFAVIWVTGSSGVEIVNTEYGKLENNEVSKLCKYSFLTKYCSLVKKLRLSDCNTKSTSTVYCDLKEANPTYQIAKKALYEAFQKAGVGTWVSKPIEQDMFQLDEIE